MCELNNFICCLALKDVLNLGLYDLSVFSYRTCSTIIWVTAGNGARGSTERILWYSYPVSDVPHGAPQNPHLPVISSTLAEVVLEETSVVSGME